jgi:lipopolysaccharide transport system permease protein
MNYEIKPQKKLSFGFNELWQYRELFYFFSWRDIKVKYKQTVLGFAWTVIQPLLMTLLFTFLLGEVFESKVPFDLPYPVFVISGLMLWNFFSSGLSNASNSMINNAHIIKKVYFPRLIIPASAILVSLFDFLISFIVFIPFLIYYKCFINFKALIYIPIALIITTIVSFGLGIFLSALNVKYRDFRYIMPFLIQFLLFITPIIYPKNISSNIFLKWIIRLNPLTTAIEFFRASFINNYTFSSEILIGFIFSIILLCLGLIYFRKTEAYFADLA